MSFVNNSSRDLFRRILLCFCCVMLLLAVISCGAMNSILPATPTLTPTASITLTSTATPTPTVTLTPTPTGIPIVCGGPPAMFILLVGSDARSNSYAVGLADAIRVVRLDFVDPHIDVLTFQRDLYVEIPGIESHHGITHGKLNQAYLYGNPGYAYYDGPGQGPGLLALTLEHNFGVHVDHYVAMNLQTFVRIVDQLGGIDVDLPYAINGRAKGSSDPNRYFPAGQQHLNGYRTMLLARLRTQGDFQRADIQNLILQAFAEKLLGFSTIPKLLELIDSFIDAVQTDLGPVEIAQLLCLRARLSKQTVNFDNFPENLFKNGRVQDPVLGNTSILEVDFDILKTYVQKFNEGNWPGPQEDHHGEGIP